MHALAAMLVPPRNTEKTSAVLGKNQEELRGRAPELSPVTDPPPSRLDTDATAPMKFTGARQVKNLHTRSLKHGDRCPDCGKGNVYGQKEPKVLVRIVGQAPLAAPTVLRAGAGCAAQVLAGMSVHGTEEPEGVGPEKYDENGSGDDRATQSTAAELRLHRLEKLEAQMGIPLPAATQWEIVEEAAELIQPARDELIRQAAQGEVVHNDDTSMKVLRLEREPGDQRTGVFTSGIVSTGQGQKIALYFTGRQHAGENIGDVLKQRAKELSPVIQMCDALSRNVPKLPAGVEILLANCLAHYLDSGIIQSKCVGSG